MKRICCFVYGVTCHGLFLATFAAMAGFVGNLGLPKTIDSPSTMGMGAAVAINLGLMLLFGLQHSVMARPRFKALWTKIIPAPIERSTYVLASCVVVWALMLLWQPIDVTAWDVASQPGRGFLWGLFAAGWLMVPAVSLAINHFDLFGTRQVWLYLNRRQYKPLPFKLPLMYRHVRHPLYLGWALAFWATPTMTFGHMLFSGVLTLYMGLAAVLEERDLVAHFGRRYRDYQEETPMFVPVIGKLRLKRPAVELQESTLADSAVNG
jgi:protein-S-isoprenylcysteine O-methyltransferase Ste14